jgi:uncharacterized protein
MSGTVTELNKQVVRDFFALLEAGDTEAAFACFTPDGEWCSPRGGRMTRDEEAANLAWFLGKMRDGIRFELGTFTAEDDRVAVTMESHAILTNDKVYNNVYHMLFELRDGRIARAWEYADSAHTQEVLVGLGDLPGLDRQ